MSLLVVRYERWPNYTHLRIFVRGGRKTTAETLTFCRVRRARIQSVKGIIEDDLADAQVLEFRPFKRAVGQSWFPATPTGCSARPFGESSRYLVRPIAC